MKVKLREKKEINFFNNQNYILWKNEKNKLISKLFIEKFLYSYYPSSLNFFYNLINNLFSIIYLLVLYFFVFFILFLAYLLIIGSIYIMFFFIIPIFIFFLYYTIAKSKTFKIKNKKIKNIKEYFNSLQFASYNDKIKTNGFREKINIHPQWLINILFIIINLFLIPFYIITLLWIFIYSLIYIFIFKWIKWYTFIKKIPKTRIIEKFKILEKNKAENKYIKIKEK